MSQDINNFRLQPLSSDQADGRNREILNSLETRGEANDLLRILAHSPNGLLPVVTMSNALIYKSSLPANIRELIILYVAARSRTKYIWDEHLAMSIDAGVSHQQRNQLWEQSFRFDSEDFLASQLLALTICTQLLDETTSLSREAWTSACETWGIAGTLDIILTTAYWGGFLPVVTRALGLERGERQ